MTRWNFVAGTAEPTAWVAMLALAAVLATCGGCGAGVLQTHATVATVAGVTLGGARDVLHDARSADLDGCEAIEDRNAALACLDERTPRWAPALLALESTRVVLAGYIEGIELARVAGDGEDVLMALVRSVARLVAKYDALAEALRGVGVEAPLLPPLARQIARVLQ